MKKAIKMPSVKHVKKDMKAEKEMMSEAKEIGKYAKEMNKDDKAYMKALKSKTVKKGSKK